MFERFTGRARRVVVLAQEEARMLDHNYIGTEHLLLGLLDEDSGDTVAEEALREAGLSYDKARQQVLDLVGEGQRAPGGHIPFTRRLKKVLELSHNVAGELEHTDIDTGHLLLGLIRERNGVTVQIVTRSGIDPHALSENVMAKLRDAAG